MTASSNDAQSDSIRDRLLKVLRLAQQGIGGERENAEVLLQKLLRKHSMTLADLERGPDQAAQTSWLPASDVDERTVLSQLALRLFGASRKHWTRTQDYALGIKLGPAEHSALVIAWEVYRAAFAEARHALMLGFCFKHGLYSAEGASASEMTDEARERAERALRMAETLPQVESPGRRISRGGEG